MKGDMRSSMEILDAGKDNDNNFDGNGMIVMMMRTL
jgi:hypothetical protein